MSYHRPYRAASGRRPQKRYHRRPAPNGFSASRILGLGAAVGIAFGVGSIAITPEGRAKIVHVAQNTAVGLGIVRARAPQVGDYWSRCDAARAAGTAPIYRGEPGYREGLDGDSDGIACEPYR